MLKKLVLILFVGMLLSGCRMLNNAGQPTVLNSPTSTFTDPVTQPSRVDPTTPNIPTTEAQFGTPTSIAPTVDSVVPSPTQSSVRITAMKGNLFIRRGPDLAYNMIAVLAEGQSAPVLAHDVLGKWVEIPVPSLPGKTGWVSIQTVFSSVSGDFMDMPEVQPTDWPVAAYIRNCTYHQMIVEPGDTTLASLLNSPDNEMWIYPGIHHVYDTEVDGQPEVLTVDLREGVTVDVRVDGNGDHRKCP
jgi:hypothetical protein